MLRTQGSFIPLRFFALLHEESGNATGVHHLRRVNRAYLMRFNGDYIERVTIQSEDFHLVPRAFPMYHDHDPHIAGFQPALWKVNG